MIVGGLVLLWVQGNKAAVSKFHASPTYLTLVTGNVLDTNKTEIEWCMKEKPFVGGNLKFILRVSIKKN